VTRYNCRSLPRGRGFGGARSGTSGRCCGAGGEVVRRGSIVVSLAVSLLGDGGVDVEL
jgi:hypothetical protein